MNMENSSSQMSADKKIETKKTIEFRFLNQELFDKISIVSANSSFVASETAIKLIAEEVEKVLFSLKEKIIDVVDEARKEAKETAYDMKMNDMFKTNPNMFLPKVCIEITPPENPGDLWGWNMVREERNYERKIFEKGNFNIANLTSVPVKLKNYAEPHLRFMTKKEKEH